MQCKKKSPETELNYSLLGLAGWREVRTERDGEVVVEWRCPECWATHKQRTRMQTQTNMPTFESLRIPRKP